MVLSKLCYTFVLLRIILRSIKTSNETKVNESYGRPVACWQGGPGDHGPPAKIFRGRQTTTGALKLCKTKFSAKTLTLFKSHLEFIERNIRLSAV